MSATGELHYLTIAEAAPLIASGELSPVELTRAYLARIEAVDGQLDSYVTITSELALSQARQAESEIQAGRYRGPPPRHPHCPQGPLRHRGHPDHRHVPGDSRPGARLRTPPPSPSSTRLAPYSWASWRCMSSPWAVPISPASSRRLATRGTPRTCPAAAAAAPVRR